MDLGPFPTADSALGPGVPETTWVQPVQDARVVPADGDPAAVAEARESIRLAFVAALQHLPPRQRAVLILREDATFSMPPYPLWLRGHVEISRSYVGQAIGCRGSKLIATAANGRAAFGSYKPAGQGTLEPFALQVVEVSGERISGLHHFLDPRLFVAFGLPPRLQR